MAQPTFAEIFRRNKPLFFTLPIALALFCYNQFVIKPARQAAKSNLLGRMPAGTPGVADTPSAGLVEAPPAVEEIPPPAPIDTNIVFPKLDEAVESHFKKVLHYPNPIYRNVFLPFYQKNETNFNIDFPLEKFEEEDRKIERPQVAFHGFLNVGSEKIAILKLGGRLYLTRTSDTLAETPYVLRTILPDSVVMIDTGDANREFAISLFEKGQEIVQTVEPQAREFPEENRQ